MQQQSQAGRADSSVGQIYSLPQGPVSPEMSNTEIIGTCWIGENISFKCVCYFITHLFFENYASENSFLGMIHRLHVHIED